MDKGLPFRSVNIAAATARTTAEGVGMTLASNLMPVPPIGHSNQDPEDRGA